MSMTYGSVARWYPVPELAERPASIFDLNWQGGEQRLIATVRYAMNADENENSSSSVVTFDDVVAFQMLDENMDLTEVTDDDAMLLKLPYPYGGRWPYLQVHASDWIKQLAERDGTWDAADFQHFVITSRNMHLHVACHTPSCTGYDPAV